MYRLVYFTGAALLSAIGLFRGMIWTRGKSICTSLDGAHDAQQESSMSESPHLRFCIEMPDLAATHIDELVALLKRASNAFLIMGENGYLNTDATMVYRDIDQYLKQSGDLL